MGRVSVHMTGAAQQGLREPRSPPTRTPEVTQTGPASKSAASGPGFGPRPGTFAMMLPPAAVEFLPTGDVFSMTAISGGSSTIAPDMAICLPISQWNSTTSIRNHGVRPKKTSQRSQTCPSTTEIPMQSSKVAMERLESTKIQ